VTIVRGILPALATPIDANGQVQTATLEKLISRLYEAGVNGLYVGGQTGEGWQLALDQRKQLAEVAVSNSPSGAQVMIHVGAMRVEDAIDLARHAGRIGAQAVSSLPPPGAGHGGELFDWYRRLAEASPLPLYVYYFPSLSPAVRGIEDLTALCELPTVAGLKFTADNMEWVAELVARGANVLFGRDEVLSAGLLMGAQGGIGTFYNLTPEWFVELYAHAQAGRWNEAVAVGEKIRRLIRIFVKYPMLAAFKAALARQGFPCGPVLSPKLNLDAAQETELVAALQQAGFGDVIERRS
jgi:N-acetylneuraminate lyase